MSGFDDNRKVMMDDLRKMGVTTETLKGMEGMAAVPQPKIPDMFRGEFCMTSGGIRPGGDGGFLFEFCMPALPFVKFYIPFDRTSLIGFGNSIQLALQNESEADTTA